MEEAEAVMQGQEETQAGPIPVSRLEVFSFLFHFSFLSL